MDWKATLDKYRGNTGNNQAGQAGQPDNGLIQQGSGLLRSIGLGAISDILGGAQFAGQKILAGQNPFSGQGETPQQLQSETSGNLFINPQKTGGAMQAGQDLAGAASWMVPETKFLKGGSLLTDLLAGGVNRGVQGAVQGGLNATSQGQNPIGGAVTGAVANPLMGVAGNTLTDALPKYIGLRNFGAEGLKLPDVVKAQSAAGDQTLKDVRNTILSKVQPFDAESTTTGDILSQSRNDLMDKINNLAQQPEWVGTPGLSALKKGTKSSLPQETGVLSNIKSAIINSSDPFDAYSRIKNMAYATDNTPAANRLSSFLHSAAYTAREHLINSTDNPAETRNAMDIYAAQTAMNAPQKGGGLIANILGGAAKGGPNLDLGAAGLAALIPALHGLSGIPLADYALTNPLTGPPLARGLVNTGQAVGNSGLGGILSRLGVSGAQGAVNSLSPQSQ